MTTPTEHNDGKVTSLDHLESIDDGCECVELWEELSEQRTGAGAE